MRVRFAALLGLAAMFLGQGAAVAQTTTAQSDAQQDLERLATATALDRAGLLPWHLRMSFELNDLNGKPKEKGTIEEWWTSPGNLKLVITSPSYNVVSPGEGEPVENRESQLVGELLRQVVHPVAHYGSLADFNVAEREQAFGKVKLSCLFVSTRESQGSGPTSPPMYCEDPGTLVLRLVSIGQEPYTIRNRMVRFQNTSLALDDAIGYGDQIAITGTVDALESYKPEASVVQHPVETDDKGGGDTIVPGIVTAGRFISRVAPVYPKVASIGRIEGTVVLGAIVSKTGTISTLYVIASSHAILSASALEAVKQWRYQPYLLNGQPTEVDTTITVNFQLNPN